ncbi:S-type anion channel SLAH4-like [Impatiens glandulifera]|uniref:S-type anion channel SLAH4-like n=1 Tax=Impatiens glandulifera TaxID=253017 RepID=UPI001FB14AE3|nr:S-type anion channel SLAH4-like [Impatiens glandulifera]
MPHIDSSSKIIEGEVFMQTNNLISTILTKFHAGYFKISLSLCSQALLWKTLGDPITNTDNNHFLRRALIKMLPSAASIFIWSISLLTLTSLSFIYVLKCMFKFQTVKHEFMHHVGVNYLFAPWISWLLLLQSSPFLTIFPKITNCYLALWWVFIVPILALDVKIYGQWFIKGKRYLSNVANPTCQMSVIGNLAGAWAAGRMDWRESAIFMFSLGIIHYLVLFVTLYQRLSGEKSVPTMFKPVFFLFIAAPSMGSLAWDSISGTYDNSSKMLFYLSLFLFLILVSKPSIFINSTKKFNMTWWAYPFPLTMIAIAAFEYSQEVRSTTAHLLMMVLSLISVLASVLIFLFTILNTNTFFLSSVSISQVEHLDISFSQDSSNEVDHTIPK